MRHNVAIAIVAGLFALTLGSAARAQFIPPESPSNEGEVPWVMNLDDAYKEAKRSGKPILLTFRCVP